MVGIAVAEEELEVLTGGADGTFLVWQIPSLVLKQRFASSNSSPLVRVTVRKRSLFHRIQRLRQRTLGVRVRTSVTLELTAVCWVRSSATATGREIPILSRLRVLCFPRETLLFYSNVRNVVMHRDQAFIFPVCGRWINRYRASHLCRGRWIGRSYWRPGCSRRLGSRYSPAWRRECTRRSSRQSSAPTCRSAVLKTSTN